MLRLAGVLVLLLLPQAAPGLRAGAATSNITPPLGEPIVGGFSTPFAAYIHDELHARCLALDDGTTKLVFVICDNVGVPREVFDEAKHLVEKETGIPPSRLLFSATHTHSATSVRGDKPLEQEYPRFFVRRIADGVRRALHNLEPAKIGWSSAQAPEHLFNRRYYMKPGTPIVNPFGTEDKVVMNPGVGNPNVDRPAGPTDPEVSFILVRAKKDDRPIGLLANYSLHYVGGVPETDVSADYFAVFSERMRELLGAEKQDPPFVGMLCNGTSGDVNNVDVLGKPAKKAPYEKMREVAHSLAAKVFDAAAGVAYKDEVRLDSRLKELVLKNRKPSAELLERARGILARPKDVKPAHIREEAYAKRTLALENVADEVSVPIQAFRIGDLGVVAIPFEVFTDTGLEIKKRTPMAKTFTISQANGAYGYLPTPEHHALGGYETWLGTNRVEVDASNKIRDKALELLGELK